MTKHTWALLLSLLLAACGGSSDASDDDGSLDDTAGDEDDGMDEGPGDTVHASAIELIGINPPEVPWSEMSHEDREMDMVSRFHPIFREIFSNHDAEEHAEFGCGDCHGEDMSERHFEMPSPHRPPVPAPGSPEYAAERAEHAEDYAFMEEHVLPPMQTMLGMGDTFTCNGCHPAP